MDIKAGKSCPQIHVSTSMNVKGVVNYSSLRLAIVVYFALMGASLVHQSKSRASVVASQLTVISTLKKINITSNLRGIRNAWHFCFYFNFSVYGTMF